MTRTTMEDINPINNIFHEKQEGSLCAQHCLNALLQGNYFTAVDLAAIGKELDETERQQMAEAGTQSDDYMRFMQQPSSNFDDSGFFSIQVIQRAVCVWNLELLPFTSSDEVAVTAREDPRTQTAYICNFREHWFTIRKLGHQWFNLNSLLTLPELVSDTYLSLLLTQLQQEGYSIFVVRGNLPDCEGDQILKLVRAVQPIKPRLVTEGAGSRPERSGEMSNAAEDPELQRALAESKRLAEEDDQSLKRALAMSLEGLPADFAFPVASTHSPPTRLHLPVQDTEGATAAAQAPPTTEELRQKRLAFLDQNDSTKAGEGSSTWTTTATSEPAEQDTSNISEYSEEKMLELALKMSMEGDT